MSKKSTAERFRDLFRGNGRAHGRYEIDESITGQAGKVAGRARTVVEPPTIELYRRHLEGELGIGIVPILDDNTCFFGAIDIDEYESNVTKRLNDFIQKESFPMVVCRTKSGGGHLYAFTSEPVTASLMRAKLTQLSEAIGFAGVEIFPKQERINVERGDVGNWINLPYFDVDGPTMRYGFNDQGKAIHDVDSFLDYAESKQLSSKEFKALKIPEVEHPFGDGPPCLQRLSVTGVNSGSGRNNALFNYAVYARKKFGDESWKDKVLEYNSSYMSPPITINELNHTIFKSVARKNYEYNCTAPPCANVCSKSICSQRKFGVGGGALEVEFMLDNLRKIVTTDLHGSEMDDPPPRWMMSVNGVDVELSTAELLDQQKWRRKVVERTTKLPGRVTVNRWENTIRDKLATCETIEIPFEVTPLGQMQAHVSDFISERGDADDREDLFDDKALFEDGHYVFTVNAFIKWTKQKRLYLGPERAIWERLKHLGVSRHETHCNGVKLNYWKVSEDVANQQRAPRSIKTDSIDF